jgi:transposase-like protein
MENYTLAEFNEQFPDQRARLDYMFRQRWPNGGTCAECGKKDCFYPVEKRRSYSCSWCGYQLYPTAGTIFHKSSTSLKSWFFAIFLMSTSRNGVAAAEIERQVGVTYKTAWRMCHEIRKLMADGFGYKHGVVNHGQKQYVLGPIHTNTIEGFWSQLKRSIDGTHHHVSGKHLQKYVDEFVFRYNRRFASSSMFSLMTERVGELRLSEAA